MYVLGIETSCDETSAAVVKNGRQILANVTASSLKFHKKYGGVVPEIASRVQLEKIAEVSDLALRDSGVRLKNIGLVAVTNGPGLLGSLLIGLSFAKAAALATEAPLIGINHLHSHIYAGFLENNISLPAVALVVSGGHTSLFYLNDFAKLKIIGETLDDACGEAFDKVAKILGLGYPGGPIIEKLALKGESKRIRFNCSGAKNPFDFSFSGIKTAVLYYSNKRKLSILDKADIAASFQKAVIDTLINKTLAACGLKKVKTLVLGGGVVANGYLRRRFNEEAKRKNIKCFFPSRQLCLDNAAMVAGLGFQLYKRRRRL